MKTSQDRVLTTHTGSLPRSEALLAHLVAIHERRLVDREEFREEVRRSLRRILDQQADAGIDIANDGELPRIGYSFYVEDRMSGFGGRAERGTMADFIRFPGYAALRAGSTKLGDEEVDFTQNASMYEVPAAVGAVVYDPEMTALNEELDLFAEALKARTGGGSFVETFVSAASPGILSTTLIRTPDHPVYRTDREYLDALADEMHKEYAAIVDRGHVLQLDAPDLAMERQIMFRDKPLDKFLDRVQMHVEAINRAVEGLPRDRVRLHVCWGNWDGPHLDDVELRDVLPYILEAHVGAFMIACANPRHQHNYKELAQAELPRDAILIPGVIDVTTNIVEHPEVVADRICQYAEAIGDATRVIAGCDCGLSSFAGYMMLAEDVAWAKLQTLRAGADLATKRLFR